MPAFIEVTVSDRTSGENIKQLVNVENISRVKTHPGKRKTIITMSDTNEYDVWAEESDEDIKDMIRETGAYIANSRPTA